MTRGMTLLIAVAIVLGGMVWFVPESDAIPVFARKCRTSCTTCHIAIPKRNAFGEAFRRNGYRLPVEDEVAVKEDPVVLGAEGWKAIWPEAIWPGAIPGTVPIAFYVHMRAVWSEGDGGNGDFTFDAPHEVEMLFGGTLTEKVSFFGEWLLFEKGKTDEGRLGSFYLQYNDLFGIEDSLNVKIGKFDPGGLDGYNAFKKDNRLTLDHYLTNDYKVVPSTVGGNKVDFRWNYRTRQSGVELNGIVADRFEYAVGIVNGNGSVSGDEDQKDVYYRLGYKLFGETMTMKNAPGGELSIIDNWRDDSITIGTHGYFGKTSLNTSALSWKNDFERFGIDLRGKYNRLEVGASTVFGNDDNPGGANEDIDSNAWFVQATYLVYPWLLPTVRYSEVNFDKNWATDAENLVFSLTALQTANMRWVAEYKTFPDDDDGEDTFKLNLQYAF